MARCVSVASLSRDYLHAYHDLQQIHCGSDCMLVVILLAACSVRGLDELVEEVLFGGLSCVDLLYERLVLLGVVVLHVDGHLPDEVLLDCGTPRAPLVQRLREVSCNIPNQRPSHYPRNISQFTAGGRGGVVARLLDSHLDEPGSIPCEVASGTMPLVGGFSRRSPVSPALSFRRCSILPSITLIGSRDLVVTSLSNLFAHKQGSQKCSFCQGTAYRQVCVPMTSLVQGSHESCLPPTHSMKLLYLARSAMRVAGDGMSWHSTALTARHSNKVLVIAAACLRAHDAIPIIVHSQLSSTPARVLLPGCCSAPMQTNFNRVQTSTPQGQHAAFSRTHYQPTEIMLLLLRFSKRETPRKLMRRGAHFFSREKTSLQPPSGVSTNIVYECPGRHIPDVRKLLFRLSLVKSCAHIGSADLKTRRIRWMCTETSSDEFRTLPLKYFIEDALFLLPVAFRYSEIAEEIWAALNIEVLRADEVKRSEYGAAPERNGGGKREIPEKTRRPATSYGNYATGNRTRLVIVVGG
ncbi:hypothetical protein PR048_020461 [Dryococelus australis]|uniref:Uncharacterized protein n=1 Tax=Dryococelus australis TaxID=614101 RepID=A0ABQ9H6B0_9NEOP|nr:hypothetical protein PR048_020461 [Dryococelus australis]